MRGQGQATGDVVHRAVAVVEGAPKVHRLRCHPRGGAVRFEVAVEGDGTGRGRRRCLWLLGRWQGVLQLVERRACRGPAPFAVRFAPPHGVRCVFSGHDVEERWRIIIVAHAAAFFAVDRRRRHYLW